MGRPQTGTLRLEQSDRLKSSKVRIAYYKPLVTPGREPLGCAFLGVPDSLKNAVRREHWALLRSHLGYFSSCVKEPRLSKHLAGRLSRDL